MSHRSRVSSSAVVGRKYIFRDQSGFTNSATRRDGTKNNRRTPLSGFLVQVNKGVPEGLVVLADYCGAHILFLPFVPIALRTIRVAGGLYLERENATSIGR
jgi:hypothetical protein